MSPVRRGKEEQHSVNTGWADAETGLVLAAGCWWWGWPAPMTWWALVWPFILSVNMFAKTLASVGLKLLERLSFYCQSETKNWDHLMRRFIDCSEETKSVWNQWVILVFITESYKALLSVFLSSGFQDFFLGWLTVKKKTKQIPSPSRPRSYISIHSLNKQVLATYYMPKTKQNTVVNKEEGREGNKSSPQRSYILVQRTKQAKHTHTWK